MSSGPCPAELLHQSYSAMPRLDSPISDPNTGLITQPWYRLIIRLWQLIGAQNTPLQSGVYFVNQGGLLYAYSPATTPGGSPTLIGVLTPAVAPGPPAAIAVGASPFVWPAPSDGFLVVSAAQVEILRSPSGWVLAQLQGGSFPLREGDEVRLTYYDAAVKPIATFFPG